MWQIKQSWRISGRKNSLRWKSLVGRVVTGGAALPGLGSPTNQHSPVPGGRRLNRGVERNSHASRLNLNHDFERRNDRQMSSAESFTYQGTLSCETADKYY